MTTPSASVTVHRRPVLSSTLDPNILGPLGWSPPSTVPSRPSSTQAVLNLDGGATHELLQTVLAYDPYNAKFGNVGKAWADVLSSLQAKGISKFNSVESIKYKTQQLITWREDKENCVFRRPKTPPEIATMASNDRKELESVLERVADLKQEAESRVHIETFPARYPEFFLKPVANSDTRGQAAHAQKRPANVDINGSVNDNLNTQNVIDKGKKRRKTSQKMSVCRGCDELKEMLITAEEARRQEMTQLLSVIQESTEAYNRAVVAMAGMLQAIHDSC